MLAKNAAAVYPSEQSIGFRKPFSEYSAGMQGDPSSGNRTCVHAWMHQCPFTTLEMKAVHQLLAESH